MSPNHPSTGNCDSYLVVSLMHIAYGNNKLVLVFEYLPEDLKMFMDGRKGQLEPHIVKVCTNFGCVFCRATKTNPVTPSVVFRLIIDL
jgi:hypothetical protein